jgi:hypothetical protein
MGDPLGCLALLTGELGASVDHRGNEGTEGMEGMEGMGSGSGMGMGVGVGAGTGRTALHYAAEQDSPSIGEALIFHGADPLLPDVHGMTPLQLSLDRHSDWLIRAFDTYGGQRELLRGRKEAIFGYVSGLFVAGYSAHIESMLESGQLELSEEEAGVILGMCEGRFESMRDPVETFELLEALGAEQG